MGLAPRGVPVHGILMCRGVISLNPRFPRPTISFDELRCCGQNRQIAVLYSWRRPETTSGWTNMSRWLPIVVGLSPDKRLKSCTMCI